jgi:hypothetical protein
MHNYSGVLSDPTAKSFETGWIVIKMLIPGLTFHDQGGVKCILGNINAEYWLYHSDSSGKLSFDVGQAN